LILSSRPQPQLRSSYSSNFTNNNCIANSGLRVFKEDTTSSSNIISNDSQANAPYINIAAKPLDLVAGTTSIEKKGRTISNRLVKPLVIDDSPQNTPRDQLTERNQQINSNEDFEKKSIRVNRNDSSIAYPNEYDDKKIGIDEVRPIALGIPLMSKKTRDSLKGRIIV
jgi:hypothetical protein